MILKLTTKSNTAIGENVVIVLLVCYSYFANQSVIIRWGDERKL